MAKMNITAKNMIFLVKMNVTPKMGARSAEYI